jgi:hypothetical protein
MATIKVIATMPMQSSPYLLFEVKNTGLLLECGYVPVRVWKVLHRNSAPPSAVGIRGGYRDHHRPSPFYRLRGIVQRVRGGPKTCAQVPEMLVPWRITHDIKERSPITMMGLLPRFEKVQCLIVR